MEALLFLIHRREDYFDVSQAMRQLQPDDICCPQLAKLHLRRIRALCSVCVSLLVTVLALTRTCRVAQADASWSGPGVNKGTSACFIFGLGPGTPERFLPKAGGARAVYMYAWPNYWPTWGPGPLPWSNPNDDLMMGYNGDPSANAPGGPPGVNAFCNQGHTYEGSPNEICGGSKNWGTTNVEIWREALADDI